MALPSITLRVLDGSDRGKVFEDLQTPITIGREEGNTIQLNDERISRFHVKIQEDQDKIVLTDLESTNGTKVNGEEIQLRILRFGDKISVGRSVLLFGSRGQIAARLRNLRRSDDEGTLDQEDSDELTDSADLDFELNVGRNPDLQSTLHVLEQPDLPERLSPVQAAQLAEVIEYVSARLRGLIASVKGDRDGETHRITVDEGQWQDILDLQSRLAEYLRAIGDPP